MFGVGEYKAKGGKVVDIVAVVDDVAIGYFDKDPTFADSWDAKTGRYQFELGDDSLLDLIDPNAKKPIKLELWLTIYHDIETGFLAGGIYDSLGDAKRAIDLDCVAITKVIIDCMEGDNLA